MDDQDGDQAQLTVTIPDTPQFRATVASELRAMAQAKTPYQRFVYLPARIRAIWQAAATLIEAEQAPPPAQAPGPLRPRRNFFRSRGKASR